MALRMINGTFDQFEIDQYGKDVLDEDLKKTTVECWHMSENSEKDKKIPIECNMPFAGDGEHMYGEHIFQDVRTGSIVQNPLEIRLNEPTTFYLFRVEVG